MLKIKPFLKAHYGKLGVAGTVASTYLFVWGVSSDPGPTMIANLILLGCVWLLSITVSMGAFIEETL